MLGIGIRESKGEWHFDRKDGFISNNLESQTSSLLMHDPKKIMPRIEIRRG